MAMDELLKLAKQAGFEVVTPPRQTAPIVRSVHSNGSWTDISFKLAEFARLIRADERERCAKVCEEADVVEFRHGGNTYQDGGRTIANAAAAIRALED